jgi:hypothetical protein
MAVDQLCMHALPRAFQPILLRLAIVLRQALGITQQAAQYVLRGVAAAEAVNKRGRRGRRG